MSLRKVIVAIVLALLVASSISRAQGPDTSVVETYFWHDGWVRLGNWTTTRIGRDLSINVDAWNWAPQYSALNVKFDNVFAAGDLTIPPGLVDDFDDGVFDRSRWNLIASAPGITYETGGVLNVDIPAGTNPSGNNQVGGAQTRQAVVVGDADVCVDFTVNTAYHQTPNTNAKLILVDSARNLVEMSIRNGSYLATVLPSGGPYEYKASAPTTDLTGKLRIVRTLLRQVTIDIRPGTDVNVINLSSDVIPVAVLGSSTFDATSIDPQTVTLAGAQIKRAGKNGKLLYHYEDVDGDGVLDFMCQVLTEQVSLQPGASTATLEARTIDGKHLRGQDSVTIVGK